MDREEYISLIRELNGYCDCKDLEALFDLRRKVVFLDENCHNLENSISDFENPKQEEKVPLIILNEKKADLENLIDNQYYPKLNNFIEQKKLKLYYHNEKNNYKKKEISSVEAHNLLEQNKIITIHCYKCDQQIDLAN